MKNKILYFTLLVFVFLSCEKDDICLEEMTPHFVVSFYDANTRDVAKQVNNLTVWMAGQDTLLNNATVTSLELPLDLGAGLSNYIFSLNDSLIQPDTLSIFYTTNDIFVSRSCGYKSYFEDVSVNLKTANWIQGVDYLSTNITSDTTTHANIYH